MGFKQIIVWIVVILVLATAVFFFMSRDSNGQGIGSSSSNGANVVESTPENIIGSEIISANDDVSIGELI